MNDENVSSVDPQGTKIGTDRLDRFRETDRIRIGLPPKGWFGAHGARLVSDLEVPSMTRCSPRDVDYQAPVLSTSMSRSATFRVTVRGRFTNLDDAARAYLLREQPNHDIFKSAYTAEGTFTYDERIQFFNFRYEVRSAATADEAAAVGVREAESFLQTLGYGYTGLKSTAVDTASIWSSD